MDNENDLPSTPPPTPSAVTVNPSVENVNEVSSHAISESNFIDFRNVPTPIPGIQSTVSGYESSAEIGSNYANVPQQDDKGQSQKIQSCSILSCIMSWFGSFMNLFNFHYPIQQEPISFFRPQDHLPTGKRDFSAESLENELDPEILEVKVNFTDELIERYRGIVEERLEATAMRHPKRIDEINLEQFPGWSRSSIFHLRMLYNMFDTSGDGLVDFPEFCSTLDEYGDESSREERRTNFDLADADGIGSIDFENFLTLMYELTMIPDMSVDLAEQLIPNDTPGHAKIDGNHPKGKGQRKDAGIGVGLTNKTSESDVTRDFMGTTNYDDMPLSPLGKSLRQINRNMSRIKCLDVVQQLQAGLF